MKFTEERLIPRNKFCGPNTNSYKEHIARYKFANQFVVGKTVLDTTCGVGYGSKMMLDAGA